MAAQSTEVSVRIVRYAVGGVCHYGELEPGDVTPAPGQPVGGRRAESPEPNQRDLDDASRP